MVGRLVGPKGWLCWAREPRDEKNKRKWWHLFEAGKRWVMRVMNE